MCLFSSAVVVQGAEESTYDLVGAGVALRAPRGGQSGRGVWRRQDLLAAAPSSLRTAVNDDS